MTTASIISIIDDNLWARNGLRDLVTSLGYQVMSFASAEEFLQSGHVDRTTCVVSDVQMPGLSGFDLQEQLRAQGSNPPIILVTAYPEEKGRERAIKAGVRAYLTKPIDAELLSRCLAAAAAEQL